MVERDWETGGGAVQWGLMVNWKKGHQGNQAYNSISFSTCWQACATKPPPQTHNSH